MYKKITERYYLDAKDRKLIRKFLIRINMTKVELCDALGISNNTLEAYLFGNRAIPIDKINKFKELGMYLKVR